MPLVIDASGDGYMVTVAANEPGSAPVRSSVARATWPPIAVPATDTSNGKPRGTTRMVWVTSSARPRAVTFIATSAVPPVATTSSGTNSACLAPGASLIAVAGAGPTTLNAVPNAVVSVASSAASVWLVSVIGRRMRSPAVTSTGRCASIVSGSLDWSATWPAPGVPSAAKPSAVARNAVTASEVTNRTSA